MNYSLTLTALAVLVVKHILQGVGTELPDSDIEKFLSVLIDIVCAVGIYIGRFRKGDLTFWGRRK